MPPSLPASARAPRPSPARPPPESNADMAEPEHVQPDDQPFLSTSIRPAPIACDTPPLPPVMEVPAENTAHGIQLVALNMLPCTDRASRTTSPATPAVNRLRHKSSRWSVHRDPQGAAPGLPGRVKCRPHGVRAE